MPTPLPSPTRYASSSWRHEQRNRDRFLRQILWLLIVVSAASMTGRILQVRSSLGKTPLLSANDRSRWASIRALIDHGTYAIDDVIFQDAARTKRDREWYTIDMVRHRGRDGNMHYYSSKPPLLATLLAGPYWVLQKLTGTNLAEHPFYVIRCMLVLTNVVPLMLLFWLLGQLVIEYGKTSWGTMFVFGAITWGTFLVTFATTLNNHIPATVSVGIALWAGLRIHEGRRMSWRLFALAGFFGAFAVTNELPALSFFAVLAAWCYLKSPRHLLTAFAPAALLIALAFFATNFAAHNSWRPPYAHRQDGPVVAQVDPIVSRWLNEDEVPPEVADVVQEADATVSSDLALTTDVPGERWILEDQKTERRWAIVAGAGKVEVREWDNWYDYERSYWRPENKTGVDRGEPSRWVYAFHMLIGHHGIFSLTPIWCLSAVGIVMLLRPNRYAHAARVVALAALVLSLVCIAFYIRRPLEDRNYGGVTSGFRWLFWLAPLWLFCMVPVADRIARNPAWRVVAWLFLAITVISVVYPALNPWVHPWLYQYWAELGWIE